MRDPLPRVFKIHHGASRTKSEFKFDSDPATLVKRFTKTGKIDVFAQTEKLALHGDFSEIPDFFTALLQCQKVEEQYLDLDIDVRRATHNSPRELFDMLADPEKIDDCIALGLRPPDTKEPLEIPTTPEEKPTEEKPKESPIQGGESPSE